MEEYWLNRIHKVKKTRTFLDAGTPLTLKEKEIGAVLRNSGWLSVFLMAGLLTGWTGFSWAQEQARELPKPDLKKTPPVFLEWNFESGTPGQVPDGFQILPGGGIVRGEWAIQEDASAPSRKRVVQQSLKCAEEPCYNLFVANDARVDYVDLSVRMKMVLGSPTAYAGLAFSVQDDKNFYAAVVHPKSNRVVVYAVKDGKPAEIAQAELILNKDVEWHFLRVQRYTIVSKEVIEVFFDQHMLLSFTDQSFGVGRLGLVALGSGGFAFDNLRAMELLTQRPFSRPSAY